MINSYFNLVEGIWWIGFAGWICFRYRSLGSHQKYPLDMECFQPWIKFGVTTRGLAKTHRILLAIILILFGISDFVEMVTSAWWRPWWLLAWKGLCLIIGIILVILILKQRKNSC